MEGGIRRDVATIGAEATVEAARLRNISQKKASDEMFKVKVYVDTWDEINQKMVKELVEMQAIKDDEGNTLTWNPTNKAFELADQQSGRAGREAYPKADEDQASDAERGLKQHLNAMTPETLKEAGGTEQAAATYLGNWAEEHRVNLDVGELDISALERPKTIEEAMQIVRKKMEARTPGKRYPEETIKRLAERQWPEFKGPDFQGL
jgi:hypothetical protein